MANRRRNQLSPERMVEIRRYATAPRVTMKPRCGHDALVPDFTDPETTDCWACTGLRNSVGFAKEEKACKP